MDGRYLISKKMRGPITVAYILFQICFLRRLRYAHPPFLNLGGIANWLYSTGSRCDYLRTSTLIILLLLSKMGSNPKLRQICNFNLELKVMSSEKQQTAWATYAVESKL